MLKIRPAHERGHGRHGWLDTWHSFSFAEYFDPAHMNFRVLRVMNEDRVAPGQGFGMHGHADMEIITYVLEGALAHRDSLGNGEVLRPGELQRMTAGTGIRHSEFNASDTEPVHLYQIWIQPEMRGLTPGYEQRAVPVDQRQGRFRLVASHDGRDGSLTVHQDVGVYLAFLEPDQQLPYTFAPQRHGWLQVLRGAVALGESTLRAGDGVAISDEPSLLVHSSASTELLLFDLP